MFLMKGNILTVEMTVFYNIAHNQWHFCSPQEKNIFFFAIILKFFRMKYFIFTPDNFWSKNSIVLNEQFKNRKFKRAVEHSPFLKKIAACECVSEWNTKTNRGFLLTGDP